MITGVDLSMQQFRAAWRLMASQCPGHALGAEEGIEYAFTGLPVAFLNTAFVTTPEASEEALRSCAERACAWAAGRSVPWLFVVTDGWLAPGVQPGSVLEGCGLAQIMRLTGMYADHIAGPAKIPEPLTLMVPADDGACASMFDVNSAAYGMDLAAAKAAFGRSFWQDHFPVVGLLDDRPVSCAAVMMVERLRYVALVATDPAHQRRGFADAAMRRALELAAHTHGECPTVLHATDAGFPVYERMGYTTISTHGIFMEKRFV